MNRATVGQVLFRAPADYETFVELCVRAHVRVRVRILTYCLMPNHWHFAIWVEDDGQLPAFLGWLTFMHAMHVRQWTGTRGRGAVYQGRYLAVPVETETYFYRLMRYIDRNAARAGLVERPEQWPWCSAAPANGQGRIALARWPLDRPTDWLGFINNDDTSGDLSVIRTRTQAGKPIACQQHRIADLAVSFRSSRRKSFL
jgi:putative transposase